jgi:hypothetical protein
MADIKTTVVIGARTDDLRSGMVDAASSVEAATQAMRTQFEALGAIAQQAQGQITTAAAEIASAIDALQAKTANLAASITGGFPAAGNTPQRDPSYAIPAGNAEAPAAISSQNAAVRGVASNRTGAWRVELRQQLLDEQNFFAESIAEELAFWKQKLALSKLGSKERAEVEKTTYDLEKRQAEENERAQERALSSQMHIEDAVFTRKRAAITYEQALGKIGAAEALAQHTTLLDAKWATDHAYYARKLAAAKGDSRAQQQIDEQEQLAYQSYLTAVDKLNEESALRMAASWRIVSRQISDAFAAAATDIVMRTKSIGRAIDNLVRSLLGDSLRSAFQNLFDAVIGVGNAAGGGLSDGLFKGLFGDGLAGLLGNPFAAASGGIGGSLAGIFDRNLPGDFDVWGATGARSIAGVGGLFGWLGGLLPFFDKGGVVPSAAGGWSVPAFANGGILSILHANEMVLPANISRSLQNMIAGGDGGAMHLHVHAPDGPAAHRFLMNNAPSIVAAFNKGTRNGVFPRR